MRMKSDEPNSVDQEPETPRGGEAASPKAELEMPMSIQSVVRTAVISCVLASACPAKTWFVGGAGADFNEISSAIQAASDGDLILVRPGTYGKFTLEKGLMIRASQEANFQVDGTIIVQNIPAGRRAGISGLLQYAGQDQVLFV